MKIVVDPGGQAARELDRLAGRLAEATPLFRSIAGMLEAETEANFAAQGRPSWVPLAKSTIAKRQARGGGSVLKVLQDSGILAASVSSAYGADSAMIGAGGAAKAYAAIQQLGGTIERAPYSVKTRLRTTAKGDLVRQPGYPQLAVFAKDSHKRARESWHQVDAYRVEIPARPYLPFSGTPDNAVLQPSTETSLLELITRYVAGGGA